MLNIEKAPEWNEKKKCVYKGGLLLLLSLFIISIITEWDERGHCVYIIMYKDGLLFLGKTHINNSCRARRPVAENNKNKNNDIKIDGLLTKKIY